MTHPSRKFMQCLHFTATKHRKQRHQDKMQTPYINHLISVATILGDEALVEDEVVLMAALLHDSVEDTDTTFEEINERFGDDVCAIVREVTGDIKLPKKERKRQQIPRAAGLSPMAKLVKLADILDNMRDLQKTLPMGWNEDRRGHYFTWAKKVVDNLRGTNAVLEEQIDDIFKKRNIC